MAVPTIDFTTGVATLPDVGILIYNGCKFSPLYETNVAGRCVKDDSQRTIMYMEYILTADGYVTMPDGAADTNGTMRALRRLLSKQGGELRYIGRGNDIEVNVPGSAVKDVKWGPIPEVLDFQPLGGGRSAKIKWSVKVHIIEPGFAGLGQDDLGGKGGPPEHNRGRGPGRGPDGGGGRNLLQGTFDGGPIKPGPAVAFAAGG